MTKRPLTAGDIVESRCTRCRVVTNHIIVAMVGDRVVRVQCNTCSGVHNYHGPAAASAERKRESKPVVAGARPPRAAKPPPAREAWLTAVAEGDPAAATEYQMTGKYRVGEHVRHPIFGVGVVRTAVADKMEVLFENGSKLLRCGK